MRKHSAISITAAVVAIFAVAGGAAAASKYLITSTHQIKPSVLKKLQGRRGPQGSKGDTGAVGATGQQGPKGDTGAVGATGQQGPKGDTGAQGSPGLSEYQQINVSRSLANGDPLPVGYDTVDGACPTGTRPLGGGYHLDVGAFPDASVDESAPTVNGWEVLVHVISTPPSTWSPFFYAVCAAVTTP